MRCLVTGASGHLGSALTRRLVSEGETVFALVRPGSDLWRIADVRDRVALIPGDLQDIEAARPSILAAAPETVFHLGWSGVARGRRNDPQQIETNVPGGLALFAAAREAGCATWIGVGSQAEYGVPDRVLTEDLPPRPVTSYGVAKLALGLLLAQLCDLAGMRFGWFRLLATYGPRDDETRLIPSVIRGLLAGERPRLTGGEQRWDFLYVDDAADALYRASQAATLSGVFNLGSGEAETVRGIVERIRDRIDPALVLGFGDVPYGPGEPMRVEADISRLRRELGWCPAVSLDAGLGRTIDWYVRQM